MYACSVHQPYRPGESLLGIRPAGVKDTVEGAVVLPEPFRRIFGPRVCGREAVVDPVQGL